MSIITRRLRTILAATLTVSAFTVGSVSLGASPASASETITTEWVTVSERQNTDFTIDLPIEKFDPALGDFIGIEVTTSVAFESEFWVRSNNVAPQRARVIVGSTLVLSTPAAADFSSTVDLQAVNTGIITLPVDETYEGNVTSQHDLPRYTSGDPGWVGPGQTNVRYESLTGVTVSGGGGQVSTGQATYGTVTVSYRYTYQTRDTIVTPAAPTLETDVACDIEPTVLIPSSDGVTYMPTRDGSTVTVAATLAPGYALADNATTTWNFTIPAIQACPTLPVEPVEPTDPTTTPPRSPEQPAAAPEAPNVNGGSGMASVPTASRSETGNVASLAATGGEMTPLGGIGAVALLSGLALLAVRRRSPLPTSNHLTHPAGNG